MAVRSLYATHAIIVASGELLLSIHMVVPQSLRTLLLQAVVLKAAYRGRYSPDGVACQEIPGGHHRRESAGTC